MLVPQAELMPQAPTPQAILRTNPTSSLLLYFSSFSPHLSSFLKSCPGT